MNNLLPDKNLLIILLLGHLIGDFIFQTNNVYKAKIKGVKGILVHSFIVTISQFSFLYYAYKDLVFSLILSTAVFAIHFMIDYLKYRSGTEDAVKYILDQITHFLSLVLLSTIINYISFNFSFRFEILRYSYFYIGLITATYFIKYFLRSLYVILKIPSEENTYYKYLETGERCLIFVFAYLHSFYFLLIALIVIPRSIYAINKNKQHIFYDIILSMLVSSSAGIIARKATLQNPFTVEQLALMFIIFILMVILPKIILDKLIKI